MQEDAHQTAPQLGQGSTSTSASIDELPPDLDFFKYAQGTRLKRKASSLDAAEELEEQADVENSEKNSKKSRIEEKREWPSEKHRVVIKGSDVPLPIESFRELEGRFKVTTQLLSNLSKNGYSTPTGIQSHATPVLCEVCA